MNGINLLELGRHCFLNKQINEALDYFDKAIDNKIEGNNKDMFELYDLRARCLQELGYEYEAINDFDKAISYSPNDCNEYYARSLSKGAILDYESEIADLEKAIELSKEDNQLNRAYNEEAIKMGYSNGIADTYQMRLIRAKMNLEAEKRYLELILNAPPDRKADFEKLLHQKREIALKNIKKRGEY